jgi:hypothetical protein
MSRTPQGRGSVLPETIRMARATSPKGKISLRLRRNTLGGIPMRIVPTCLPGRGKSPSAGCPTNTVSRTLGFLMASKRAMRLL